MQSTTGRLIILDPHLTPQVFWNGQQIPILDLRIKNKAVVLVIDLETSIPEDLENSEEIDVIRRAS